jgi:hypothetical protein
MAIQSITNKNKATVFKSITWFALTLFFGLSQILFVVLISLLSPGISFSIEQIFFDGGLLFFSIALISSLMVDSFLFRESVQDFRHKLLFAFFPIVLFSICSVVFVMCYLQTQLKTQIEIIDLEVAVIAQLLILFFTAIYAILLKQKSFKQCDN